MAIHEGLAEGQDDILEAIANFTDNFHVTVTTLSAPQVHVLLNHIHARHAGSHSFLAAVWCGKTLTRTEFFLGNGPTKLPQSFSDWLPEHQIDIERGSTCPTEHVEGSRPFQQGASNPPGGCSCQPSNHAQLQLWNRRCPNYRPYKG